MILSNELFSRFSLQVLLDFFLQQNRLHNIHRGFTHYKYYRAFFCLSITDLPHHLSHILNLSFLFESNYIFTNSVKPVTFALMPYNIFMQRRQILSSLFIFKIIKTDFLFINQTETSKFSILFIDISSKKVYNIFIIKLYYTIQGVLK